MEFLTSSEVSEIIRHSPRTITRWARSGLLPAYEVSNSLLFDKNEILDWVKSRKITACQRTPNSRDAGSTPDPDPHSIILSTTTQSPAKRSATRPVGRPKQVPGQNWSDVYEDLMK